MDKELKKIIQEHIEGSSEHLAIDCPQFEVIKKYLPKELIKRQLKCRLDEESVTK